MNICVIAFLLLIGSVIDVNGAASSPPRWHDETSSSSDDDVDLDASGDFPLRPSASSDFIRNPPPGTPISKPFKPNVGELVRAHPMDPADRLALEDALEHGRSHRRKDQYEPMLYAEQESLNYMHILSIEKDRKKIKLNKKITVGVVDSAADLVNRSFDVSRSTQELLKGDLSKQHHHAAHKVHSHGNHVTNIIHNIAPNVIVSYCNTNFDENGEPVAETNDQAVRCLNTKISPKIAFINLSMKLNDRNHKLMPEAADAIRAVTQAGIGIVMGLGNDSNSANGKIYAQSLIELAKEPEIKGRLLLVAASEYSPEGVEYIAPYSNHPTKVVDKHFVITAPGTNILSKGVKKIPLVMSGTSQATPIVTGVSVLLQSFLTSRGLDASSERVFDLLKRSARMTTSDKKRINVTFGNGIVNLGGAMNLALKEAGLVSEKTRKKWRKEAQARSSKSSPESRRPLIVEKQVDGVPVGAELHF